MVPISLLATTTKNDVATTPDRRRGDTLALGAGQRTTATLLTNDRPLRVSRIR